MREVRGVEAGPNLGGREKKTAAGTGEFPAPDYVRAVEAANLATAKKGLYLDVNVQRNLNK